MAEIEYREDADWDRGQGSRALIVAKGHGSSGDTHYPGTFATTYLGLRRLPIAFGTWGSVHNGAGFGMEVVDRSPRRPHGDDPAAPGESQPGVDRVHRPHGHRGQEVGMGTTTWGPAEKLCVEGTWE
jgi:hypothetical protein